MFILEKSKHRYVYAHKHTHSGKGIEMKSRSVNKKTVELIMVFLYHRALHSITKNGLEPNQFTRKASYKTLLNEIGTMRKIFSANYYYLLV